MDEAGFDRAIVLLFGKFRYLCCNEDDRLGMIPAVFIPSPKIDGGYTYCTFAERLGIDKLALFKKARCIRNVHAVYAYIK
jgi:hypothetical protein